MYAKNKELTIPVYRKYCLTISEATKYFNIGESKFRQIINNNFDSNFILHNGNKVLIKRKLFEDYLNACNSI